MSDDSYQSEFDSKVSDSIDVAVFFMPFKRHFIAICLITFLTIVIGTVYAFTRTPIYTASAGIMPVGSEGAEVRVESKLQFLKTLIGGSSGGVSNTRILDYLKSYMLAEKIYYKYKDEILANFYKDSWDPIKKELIVEDGGKPIPEQKIVNSIRGHILSGKQAANRYGDMEHGTTISAEAETPEFAKRFLEIYLEELRNILNENALSISSRNKEFIRSQLEKNKRELLEESMNLSGYHAKFGITAQNSIIKVPLNEPVDPHETEPKAIRYKDVNSDVYLDYLINKQNNLKLVNSQLMSQYENAKIEAEKQRMSFEILNKPLLPLHKSKPKRLQMMVISAFMGLFFGCCYAYMYDIYKRTMSA